MEKVMHETARRLFEAAKLVRPEIDGPADLARALNQSEQTINNWSYRGENGVSRDGRLIAQKELGISAIWIKEGVGPMLVSPKHNSNIPDASISAQEGGKIVKLPVAGRSSISSEPIESNVGDRLELREGRSVAIVGEVQGGPDGYISIDDYPAGHGHSHLPEVRSRDAGAYGLKVRGDSMRPRIKSGEYIAVEPNVEAQPGDDVVVKFLDGSCVVKELLWIRDGDVCLGSINNGVPPITRPMTEIVHIHRVAAIMPRGSAVESRNRQE